MAEPEAQRRGDSADEKLYTLSEISQKTNISMPTLQRYKKMYQDRIPSVGQGRKQRYPESALPVFDEIKTENAGKRGRPRKDASAPRAARPAASKRGPGRPPRAAKAAPAGRRGRKPAAAAAAPRGAAAKPRPAGRAGTHPRRCRRGAARRRRQARGRPQGRLRPRSGPSGEIRRRLRQSVDAHPDQRDDRYFLSHAGSLRAHARRPPAERRQGPRAPFLSASGGRVPPAPFRERPRWP